jgi:hypothetical protein
VQVCIVIHGKSNQTKGYVKRSKQIGRKPIKIIIKPSDKTKRASLIHN